MPINRHQLQREEDEKKREETLQNSERNQRGELLRKFNETKENKEEDTRQRKTMKHLKVQIHPSKFFFVWFLSVSQEIKNQFASPNLFHSPTSSQIAAQQTATKPPHLSSAVATYNGDFSKTCCLDSTQSQKEEPVAWVPKEIWKYDLHGGMGP